MTSALEVFKVICAIRRFTYLLASKMLRGLPVILGAGGTLVSCCYIMDSDKCDTVAPGLGTVD